MTEPRPVAARRYSRAGGERPPSRFKSYKMTSCNVVWAFVAATLLAACSGSVAEGDAPGPSTTEPAGAGTFGSGAGPDVAPSVDTPSSSGPPVSPVVDTSGPSVGNDPTSTNTPSGSGATACDASGQLRGTSHDRLRRLSRGEIAGTLKQLLGSVYDEPEVTDRVASLPPDEIQTAGDFVEATPASLPLTLAQIAERAVTLGMADVNWRRSLATCAADSPITTDCTEQVVRSFGARVWRRSLTESEVTDYVAFAAEAGGGEAGLRMLLRRLLQSPSLVFHLEPSTGETNGGRLRLTDFEVASRIAYAITDSGPDEELLQAAERGELSRLDAVVSQATRLLQTPAGRTKARDFARYYLHLPSEINPPPAVLHLHALPDAPGLGAEMRGEALDFFETVTFEQDGTFRDLMLSDQAIPRSAALATIFGISGPVDGAPVSAPQHPGLLHRPALLTSRGSRTSPITRGARVRKQFLCTNLALPNDATVIAQAQSEIEEAADSPNHEAVTRATSSAECQGCHLLINPLGFAFEGFDQLGMPRSEETVFDDQGEVLRTFAIDTQVDSPRIDPEGPASVANSRELVAAIAESEVARQCLVQRMFEYYRRSVVVPELDGCSMQDALATGPAAPLHSVMVSMVANEDVFWRKVTE